jgi:adenylate cyclase
LTGERVQRRLAAILAADVAGFSALMERDEEGTYSRIGSLRRDVIEPRLSEHQGRLIKTTGDGFLAEFASPIAALRCALAIQGNQLDDPNALRLRIGLNLGDIIIEQSGDVYGEGVNVAARLESLANPGGILISGKIHSEVEGKVTADFEDRGEQQVKNITRPVRIYAVHSATASIGPASIIGTDDNSRPLALPDKPSIAVLPFQNMSGDPEQEYFADGMVEDIITALSRFNSLFVIARNSSFIYKDKAVDIKRVGRELGVRYVLEGSVRKAGGKVRITGQLIEAATGTHLWADKFDGALIDAFELQDQVTTNVVAAVAPRLDQAENERAKRKPVENLDAYDCFLRGMAYSYMLTKESQEEALRMFYRAMELDPEFATPYGMAARCYAFRKIQGRIVDKDWEEAETRRLGLRLVAIGQDDALALCSAGYALLWVCKDYEVGTSMIDQALSINQNLAAGWQVRGSASIYLGQHERALEEFARAMRLNPKDPEAYRPKTGIAAAYLCQGRYSEALEWAAKSLAHQQRWGSAIWVSAASAALIGRTNEARQFVDEILEQTPTMRISNLTDFLPFRRAEDIGTFVDGLRLAGLPE